MKASEKTFSNLDELPEVAKWVIHVMGRNKIIGLTGNLGAGKTTLVKEIVKQLGSTDTVQSPTFSLVNEYNSPNGKIYHIDAYRINHIEEALRIGLEDLLYEDNYCFVEWCENISPLLPSEMINFDIQVIEENKRKISLI